MKISVLVPFGADNSPAGKQRRRVWEFNQGMWVDYFPHLEIVVGVDEEFEGSRDLNIHHCERCARPFSVSRALNDAAARATGDAFLLFGADHMPDGKAVIFAQEELLRHSWVRLFDRIAYASAAVTTLIMHHHTATLTGTDWHEEHAPCPGVLAVRRAAWERVGGMDEAFEGWGYEDTDLLTRLARDVPGGRMEPSGRILHELYVPSPRDLNGPNKDLYEGKYR